MKIIAAIPYVNRPDLLERALLSLLPFVSGESTPLNRILVIDNSGAGDVARLTSRLHAHHDSFRLGWLSPTVPLSFAQTQNAFQMLITGDVRADVVIFMHSDGEATPEAVQRLLSAIESEPPGWGVIFTHYDVLCAFSREAIERVGPWDINIPWYLSDCDWYRRVRLAGLRTVDIGGEGVTHRGSSTIKQDYTLELHTAVQTRAAQLVYREKWGGLNEQELFTVPYDGHDLVMPPYRLSATPLYNALLAAHDPGQGTLLDQISTSASAQLRTIAWVARQAAQGMRGDVFRILETGTARGEFGYVLSTIWQGRAALYTHDTNPGSRKAVQALSQAFEGRGPNTFSVTFCEGDTKETLVAETARADLAWIDGGHDYETAYHDLMCALEAEVPWVMVDDCTIMPEPNKAVGDVLDVYPHYEEVASPWAKDDVRGIRILRRRG